MFTRRILALVATLLTALTIAGATAGVAAGPSHSVAYHPVCTPTYPCGPGRPSI